MHWRRKWQPTPVFLPGESQGWGSLLGCHLWGRTEMDMPDQLNLTHFLHGIFHLEKLNMDDEEMTAMLLSRFSRVRLYATP